MIEWNVLKVFQIVVSFTRAGKLCVFFFAEQFSIYGALLLSIACTEAREEEKQSLNFLMPYFVVRDYLLFVLSNSDDDLHSDA